MKKFELRSLESNGEKPQEWTEAENELPTDVDVPPATLLSMFVACVLKEIGVVKQMLVY